MRSIASLLAPMLALAPAASLACTPAIGYRVPTNLELAAKADLILLGKVTGGPPAENAPGASAMVVEPIAAIKGLLPGQPFPLRGGRVYPAGDPAAEPSDPLELQRAHPNAFAGACNRYVFAEGATVLFFLDRREGEWASAAEGPFVRWAEDVSGEDAPWVQLAKFYAGVASLPEDDRKALMEAERDALLARTDDPVAQAMGGDIDRQLAGPNAPLAPALADPADGFRDPSEPSAVQRALDAMRADRQD